MTHHEVPVPLLSSHDFPGNGNREEAPVLRLMSSLRFGCACGCFSRMNRVFMLTHGLRGFHVGDVTIRLVDYPDFVGTLIHPFQV